MIKYIIVFILILLISVFIYMVLGAILLKIFLILIRYLQRFKFFRYFTDKFLIKEQIEHPNTEVILWCTIFWPILICMYIIVIPTMLFVLIVEKMFNNVEK